MSVYRSMIWKGDSSLHPRTNGMSLPTMVNFMILNICSNLMAEGERFSTKSDSEIALGLYRKMGVEFTRHLRGEFAFALYDRTEDELLLLRDRFGVRPLFYWVSPMVKH